MLEEVLLYLRISTESRSHFEYTCMLGMDTVSTMTPVVCTNMDYLFDIPI